MVSRETSLQRQTSSVFVFLLLRCFEAIGDFSAKRKRSVAALAVVRGLSRRRSQCLEGCGESQKLDGRPKLRYPVGF